MTFIHTLCTFALASAAAIACQTVPQGSDTGVTIDLDRTSYRGGSQVRMRVTNHTNETLGFNPCTRIVERRQGDSWVTVPEPGRVCTMQLYLLSPHGTRTETTELPSWIPRGTYRLALVLTRENAGVPAPTVRAVSGLFQVE